MKAKTGRQGFVLLEAVTAISLMAFLFAGLTVISVAYRNAIAYSGTETVAGKVYYLSPSDGVAIGAKAVLAEVASLNNQAQFTICADTAVQESDILSLVQMPYLASATGFTSPGNITAILRSNGVVMNSSGYSAFFIGHNLQVIGTLVVTKLGPSVASDGINFVAYKVQIYGALDSGFGLLYEYSFASEASTSQPLVTPSHADGTWALTFPDPTVRTDYPNGVFHANAQSTTVYALPSKL